MQVSTPPRNPQVLPSKRRGKDSCVHSMVGVGRDLKGHLAPAPPCHELGHLPLDLWGGENRAEEVLKAAVHRVVTPPTAVVVLERASPI